MLTGVTRPFHAPHALFTPSPDGARDVPTTSRQRLVTYSVHSPIVPRDVTDHGTTSGPTGVVSCLPHRHLQVRRTGRPSAFEVVIRTFAQSREHRGTTVRGCDWAASSGRFRTRDIRRSRTAPVSTSGQSKKEREACREDSRARGVGPRLGGPDSEATVRRRGRGRRPELAGRLSTRVMPPRTAGWSHLWRPALASGWSDRAGG